MGRDIDINIYPKNIAWYIEKSGYDTEHQLITIEPQPLCKVLPRHFPGRCTARRRERPEFGRVSVTIVLHLNRVKIDREHGDFGTIYNLLIIEETAARLCLTRGDGE